MSQYIVKVDVIKGQSPFYYGPYDFDKAYELMEELNETFTAEIILLIP